MSEFAVKPVPSENYEGRQWGYMILQDGIPYLHITTGGTGTCWNIAEAATYDSRTGDVIEGMEEGESMHVCELDDLIDALILLRDSEANRLHIERWS